MDIGNLVKGWNVVRLDEPFVIKSEYADVKVGCFLKHDLAIKPMAVDNGPAVIGRGDVYAEYTTFKSLANDYGKDANLVKVVNSTSRIDLNGFASGTYFVKTADSVVKVVK